MNAQQLIEQIRKARALKVTVGEWTFHARRPRDLEVAVLTRDQRTTGELAVRFVEGWEGVKVRDVVGGEDETALAFDQTLWEEFVSDRPEVYGPVGRAIMDAYLAHSESREAARKN